MATKNINTKNSVSAGSSRKRQPTIEELRQWYAKAEHSKAALQLLDPASNAAKTFNTFSKDILRTYMENPLRNYRNLRNLSKFLYYRSQPYRRLIQYNANMIDLNYRSVIPNIDLTKGFDINNDMQAYYETLMYLNKLPLNTEFYKMLVIAWREDAAFGCAYFDDDGGMFILPLPADYCVITGIYYDGSLAFDFDMSYFSSKQDILEMWGEPFTSMYNAYQADTTNGKYQPMPDDVAVCLKVNMDSPEDILMPFMGMFDSLISLEDLIDISAVADQQEIYKLLAMKIPLLDNTNEPNDFAVDIDVAIEYYNKIVNEILPDYTNAVILPGLDVDDISFDSTKVNDVTKVENATKAVFNSAGGGQVLHNANISGTTGLNLASKSDEAQALRPLLGEIESIMNRLLSHRLSNPAKVKFLEVTRYTKEEYKASIIKDMNYGVPFVMTLGALNGYSEMDMIAMANVNNALGLETLFKPMATASTRSNTDSATENPEGGRPTEDDTELTEDGEASREKRETSNG